MAEETQVDNEEAFAKVQGFIKEQVQEFLREEGPNLVPTPQQPTPDPVKEQQERVKELINPFIEPGINQATFLARDAKDYVDFYTSDAGRNVDKELLEETFKKMAEAGRPTSRRDIAIYLQGQEFNKDPDAFIKKQSARRKAELDSVASAVDMGSGSLRVKEDHPLRIENFQSLNVEEMEKVLANYVIP